MAVSRSLAFSTKIMLHLSCVNRTGFFPGLSLLITEWSLLLTKRIRIATHSSPSMIYGFLGIARYDHRLHALLPVTQGMTCPKVAKLMGDSVKTVQRWVKRFNGMPVSTSSGELSGNRISGVPTTLQLRTQPDRKCMETDPPLLYVQPLFLHLGRTDRCDCGTIPKMGRRLK